MIPGRIVFGFLSFLAATYVVSNARTMLILAVPCVHVGQAKRSETKNRKGVMREESVFATLASGRCGRSWRLFVVSGHAHVDSRFMKLEDWITSTEHSVIFDDGGR